MFMLICWTGCVTQKLIKPFTGFCGNFLNNSFSRSISSVTLFYDGIMENYKLETHVTFMKRKQNPPF
jgi:hypothetical protein